MLSKVTRWISVCLVVISTTGAWAHPALASTSHVVISELSTGSVSAASQEFIELYNPTASVVSLSSWQLEYKSATATSAAWSKRATLSGSIASFGFYLVATKGFVPSGDSLLTDGMAESAGHVRLLDQASQVVDLVGYGATANASETSPAPAAGDGHSLERLPGASNALAGNSQDTGNNSQDFTVRITPEPQTTASPTEDPATPAPADTPIPGGNVDYSPLRINELLPNPASPATDAKDEYIELYNDGDQPLSLSGLVLACGSSFHAKFTLPSGTIPAHGYATYFSLQSKLALTNSGGAARLQTALGTVLDETPSYGSAADGQAWAYFSDGWDWTTTPTPGSINVATDAPAKVAASRSSASSSSGTSSASKVQSAKAGSSAKVKAAKAPSKRSSAGQSADGSSPLQTDTLSFWLIIGLASLTIGYAIYEYRARLLNLYRVARSHLTARRALGSSSKGR